MFEEDGGAPPASLYAQVTGETDAIPKEGNELGASE